ncbi:MAG: hypothetical protein U0800_07925 [Isosphaeraceae bacterium]
MLADLRDLLVEDKGRTSFSPDIERANKTLLRLESLDSERQTVMDNWLQGHRLQPCIFGKVAGRFESMHFCFLTRDDLTMPDDHIREKIADSRRTWKRRALVGIPTHGFMLVVCDEVVLRARPNAEFRDFALHLQGLVGWAVRPNPPGNDIVDEWLFLTNPHSKEIVKFTFSVDFFASAADGRWWHDHRVPGGMAFTANSLGHMVWQNRWYEPEKKPYTIEWALRTAMNTIDSAYKDREYCPATYLLGMGPDGPRQPCKWEEAESLPQNKNLVGKDHSSYEGYLHTDHSVRAEFFDETDKPARYEEPYLMDFTYIFDNSATDNLLFMKGEPVDRNLVEAELSLPEPVKPVSVTTTYDAEVHEHARPRNVAAEIEQAVDSTEEWRLSDQELEEYLR